MRGRAAALVGALLLLPCGAHAQRLPSVLFAEGVLALEAGEAERALELFAAVIEQEPEHQSAYHYRGLAHLAAGQHDLAVEALEDAQSLSPDNARIGLDLGLAYLLLGNLAFAARTLSEASQGLPDSSDARYALGVALARQGDCDLAERHLADARRLEPEMASQTRYVAAICHARAGDLEEARTTVAPIVRSDLSSPLADASRRLVRIALRAEGIPTEHFTGSATLALGYDSNPTLASRTSERYDSFVPALQLDMTARAVAREAHTLAGRLSAYRSFNLPSDEAADYNYTHVAASAYYRYRGRIGEIRHELHAGYDFALGLFDGGPPLSDPNYLYSEHHGGRLAWTVRETDSLQTRLTVLLRHGTYSLRRRNNLGVTVALGQSVGLAGRQLLLMVEGTMRLEDAESRDYDVVAPGILAAMTWTAPARLTLSAWALYEHEDHPASRDDRVDNVLATSVALEWAAFRYLTVGASWRHTENFSSVQRFDYGRDEAALFVTGRL